MIDYNAVAYGTSVKLALSDEDVARIKAGESPWDVIFPKSAPRSRWRRFIDKWSYRLDAAWQVLKGDAYIE